MFTYKNAIKTAMVMAVYIVCVCITLFGIETISQFKTYVLFSMRRLFHCLIELHDVGMLVLMAGELRLMQW